MWEGMALSAAISKSFVGALGWPGLLAGLPGYLPSLISASLEYPSPSLSSSAIASMASRFLPACL